jgi:hypothetical protein
MAKIRSTAQKRKSIHAGKGRTVAGSSGRSGVAKQKKQAPSKLDNKSNRTLTAQEIARNAALDQSRGVDFDLLDKLVSEITKKRDEDYNIVERCGALKLPLVLKGEDSLHTAFHAALAELEIYYQDASNEQHQNDLRLVLESVYGRTTIDKEFRVPDPDLKKQSVPRHRKQQRPLSLRLKDKYQSIARDHIIGIVYPWYNKFLYRTVQRMTEPRGLNVEAYRGLEGDYRYFRSYPVRQNTVTYDSGKFVIKDGHLKIEFDDENHMVCFGHTSAGHQKEGYEHRGLVFPRRVRGSNFYDLLSFRGGKMRMTSISGEIDNASDGIVLSATRGIPYRPFAARFLMVKADSQASGDASLYQLQMPKNDEDAAQNKPYQDLLVRFKEIVVPTTLAEHGYMWGSELV